MAQRATAAPAEAFRYTPIADRELALEQQSHFTLRPLTLNERAAARDNMTRVQVRDGERLIVQRSRQLAVDLTLAHLVSAENFPAGDPKPWPADGSLTERRAYLELLGDDLVNELGNEVYDRSTLEHDGGAAKNS